jgi:cytochrome c oxidase subunit 4
MSSTSNHGHDHPPITSVGTYVAIWGALMIGTALTVLAASQDFGALNTPIALGIAITKASLVIIFFMGVRYNTPLTKLVAVSGFVWILILFGIGMSDYLTRPWIGVPGR